MKNSELMYAAIAGGADDDVTVAACLDAHREQPGGTLLGACLEVARIWHARQDARTTARAAKMLRRGSVLRPALMKVIVIECPRADEDATAMVTILAGDSWPHLLSGRSILPDGVRTQQNIGVGALWVIHRGEVIRAARDARAARGRRRRSK